MSTSQGGASPRDDAGTELSRNLTVLANNPNSVAALTGAGRAALELEDPEAALTFFGRAEELAPQDGTIKTGIGTALVLMEQGETALRFFEEAVRLGVPQAEFANHRGLAFDLTGDPARAQQDYHMALRRREDPEVRRRLALSLAISGKRDAALAVIDDQLRRQDRAAWRTRAFVLALTGDTEGAIQGVQAAMPAQAAAMAPFLARLPSLSPGDRARAVHFGHFPGEGPSIQGLATTMVQAPAAANPVTSAGRPDPSQRPLGQSAGASAAPSASDSGARIALTPLPPAQASVPAARDVATQAAPAAPRTPQLPAAVSRLGEPALAGRAAPPIKPTSGLADIAALVEQLSDPPAPGPAARPGQATRGTGPAGRSEKPGETPRKGESAAPKEAGRNWVQLAHGPTEASLTGPYRRIRAKTPKLFAGRSFWTASQRSTNRLLVGPFKSNKEAQEFMTQLTKADVEAISWTSPAGLEIKKLPAK